MIDLSNLLNSQNQILLPITPVPIVRPAIVARPHGPRASHVLRTVVVVRIVGSVFFFCVLIKQEIDNKNKKTDVEPVHCILL